jgi:hypothetical protein
MVNLLRLNPNIVVVCDSDRSFVDEAVKARVLRIQEEVASLPNAHIWITAAREIENYLPGRLIGDVFGVPTLSDPTQFESMFPRESEDEPSYIERNLGRRTFDKMEVALQIAPAMTSGVMAERFDWKSSVTIIVDCIRAWNV